MAKKPRRSAVDEVSGGASPVARKIRAQKEAARRARDRDGVADAALEPSNMSSAPEQRRPLSVPTKNGAPRGESGGVVSPPPLPREERPKEAAKAKSRPKRKPKKKPVAKRIPVTGTEGDVWEGVCRALSERVDAKVTFAAASRAIWAMVVEFEDQFADVEAPQLYKPAHADAVGNAEFESEIKAYLLEVIQKSRRR